MIVLQYIVGIVQVAIAIIGTLIQLFYYNRMLKSLGRYWCLVFIYFILLAPMLAISDTLGRIWFFSAWIIAVYWCFHFYKWLR